MENARPSSLRGDTRPRSDRGLLARGKFTQGDGPHRADSPRRTWEAGIPCLFVLRPRPVLPYAKGAAVLGS
jgi:hypothetical protein